MFQLSPSQNGIPGQKPICLMTNDVVDLPDKLEAAGILLIRYKFIDECTTRLPSSSVELESSSEESPAIRRTFPNEESKCCVHHALLQPLDEPIPRRSNIDSALGSRFPVHLGSFLEPLVEVLGVGETWWKQSPPQRRGSLSAAESVGTVQPI
ncbi:hypothetical protein R1flu_027205 [Riccia fluitans]|uniref:Uncharacterized protein n=1 Tax=Riccia fluitans TaxID=41844 RepID=A0ABD1XI44_9MARC